jgi:hypothetical protein
MPKLIQMLRMKLLTNQKMILTNRLEIERVHTKKLKKTVLMMQRHMKKERSRNLVQEELHSLKYTVP